MLLTISSRLRDYVDVSSVQLDTSNYLCVDIISVQVFLFSCNVPLFCVLTNKLGLNQTRLDRFNQILEIYKYLFTIKLKNVLCKDKLTYKNVSWDSFITFTYFFYRFAVHFLKMIFLFFLGCFFLKILSLFMVISTKTHT